MSIIGALGFAAGEFDPYRRDRAFSYRCHACGRCCHDKRIQVDAYEILRLARRLGLATGEFMRRFLRARGPWLRNDAKGACVFLEAGRCAVHEDRPLACRLWPLARHHDEAGVEFFAELPPQSGSIGEWGRDGRVTDYLAQQGAQAYITAADQYADALGDLVRRLIEARVADPAQCPDVDAALLSTDPESGQPRFLEWLDADLAAERWCAMHGSARPTTLDQSVTVHIAWLGEPGSARDPPARRR